MMLKEKLIFMVMNKKLSSRVEKQLMQE